MATTNTIEEENYTNTNQFNDGGIEGLDRNKFYVVQGPTSTFYLGLYRGSEEFAEKVVQYKWKVLPYRIENVTTMWTENSYMICVADEYCFGPFFNLDDTIAKYRKAEKGMEDEPGGGQLRILGLSITTNFNPKDVYPTFD